MTRLAGTAVITCAIAVLSAHSPVHAQSGNANPPMPGHHLATQGPGMPAGTSPDGMPMKQLQMTGDMPTLPGQDAFGALQEIVRILEADPRTRIVWSEPG